MATSEKSVVAENLPAVQQKEGERHIRIHMARLIERFARDKHAALALLERFDRALWASSLSGSDSAELARKAYECGASEMLRDVE